MATTESDPQVIVAARSEADRRRVGDCVVVTVVIRRFVPGADLTRLLDGFDADDKSCPAQMSDTDALSIAAEELATVRAERTARNT